LELLQRYAKALLACDDAAINLLIAPVARQERRWPAATFPAASGRSMSANEKIR
jgi:hypothetical protein